MDLVTAEQFILSAGWERSGEFFIDPVTHDMCRNDQAIATILVRQNGIALEAV